jgi:hypothetical protein
MAFPIIAVATALLPELIRIIGGDRAGTAATQVADAVRTITGTDDPAEAQRTIETDPAKATELRVKLAEIAVEQQKAQLEAEDKRRQAELEELKTRTADTQGARGTMIQAIQAGSWTAWGAPLMSTIITLGFFVVVTLMIFGRTPDNNNLLNIVIGALVASFTAVVNFWLGSSQGSREKDATVQALQQSQAAQTTEAIRGIQSLATQPGRAGPTVPVVVPQGDNFARCLDVVFKHEGGFSDHPLDKGGPTNLGITMKTLKEFREKDVTVDDLKNLRPEEAREIYRARYWNVMRCNDLPPGVDLMVFDFGVNAGPGTSIRTLQGAAGVTVDGSIGPITLAAVRARSPAELLARFADRRMEHYRALESFPTFGAGWTNRTNAVKEAALRMAIEATAQRP